MSTYRIPEVNLPRLTADMAKLAKRAAKIGVTLPTMKIVEWVDETDKDLGLVRRYAMVEVLGDAPKFDGWRLTAVIEMDREDPDGPNVVVVLPGEQMDAAWRNETEHCDHCHVGRRNRKLLVVVTHDNGEQKIVGSTCLKDFLGHAAPEQIAQYCTHLLDFTDYETDRAPGQGEVRFDPASYLGWVVRAMNLFGWTSRGEARNGGKTATADIATDLWAKSMGMRRLAPGEERPEPLTEAELAEAEKALEWGQAIDPQTTNDYLANVYAVAVHSTFRQSHLGIAASMVMAYRRDAEKAIVAAAPKVESFPIGTVGAKIQFTATVVLVKTVDGEWGPKALVKLTTVEGNNITWWASNPDAAPKQGDTITGSAKVKKYERFKDIMSTVVTHLTWTTAS